MDRIVFRCRSDLHGILCRLERSNSLFRRARVVNLIVVDNVALSDFARVQTRQIIFGLHSLRQFLLW